MTYPESLEDRRQQARTADYGERTGLTTYRDEAGNYDWTAAAWPNPAAADGDTTTWAYHADTGLLTGKTYADGNAVTYTYTTGGKLKTRTWARLSGTISTTYAYDPDTGELTGIDYSDMTPNIAFGAYDRLGRLTQVTDGVAARTLAYNDVLQLETETLSGLFFDKVITRGYETASGGVGGGGIPGGGGGSTGTVPGRPASISVGPGGGPPDAGVNRGQATLLPCWDN